MKKKLLKFCKENNLSHIGSCLGSINGIDAIYKVKNKNEKFILSNGHAAVSLYIILEKNNIDIKAEELLKWGIHPNRLTKIINDGIVYEPIDCSTGSLGMGLTVAVGMALADRNKNVYCMVSDGEMSEGCIYESLRIAYENKLTNLKLLINANGWGAYKKINVDELIPRFQSFGWGVLLCKDNVKEIKNSLNVKVDDVPIVIFIKTKTDFGEVKGLSAHYDKT